MIKKIIKNIISAVFWLTVWQIMSQVIGSELLLPSPVTVFLRIITLASTFEFWYIISASFVRVLAAIVISIVLGVILAVFTSRYVLVDALISPIMNVIKATPVASFIMLALLWINRDVLPVFISVLIVVPVVWANVCGGIKNVDKSLLSVTYAYKFSFFRRLKRLYIPSVYPYFWSACRSSLGLAWKSAIAAEVLAVPVFAIGKMIYSSKMYLETVDLFAWSTVVILLSVIIEYVFCAMVKKMGSRFERQVTVC